MIVILNPAAGQRRAASFRRVIDALIARGMRPRVTRTTGPGHAIALAHAAASGHQCLVVAAGGDGTIAEVAAGLLGSGSALGIIPLGTANVLAHELGLPRHPVALAATLAACRTRPLWPGLARTASGERLFVQMVSVGLDAQVVHRINPALKRLIGRPAYVLQALREIGRYPYPPIRLRLDGHPTEAAGIVVSKGRRYGGRYTLAPDARNSEPGFSVALLRHPGARAALGYGTALALGRLAGVRGLDIVPARLIEILGGADPAQADGDAAGTTPIIIRDAAACLQVVIGTD